jgi:hypothetical protein
MTALSLALSLVAGLFSALPRAQTIQSAPAAVEDIYIARSVRESRVMPTDYCSEARTGFTNFTFEEQFTLRSTATRAADGLMISTNAKTIGRLRACFGSTSNAGVHNFYAEGVLGALSFVGKGECRIVQRDYPEAGITPVRCFLDLLDLPKAYVGGELTTNSIVSRAAIGLQSDPPGYTQPSIATIRLWKRR